MTAVYSKKIFLFISEIRETIHAILSKEVGLKVTRNRFYDKQLRYSYPIQVVIYNNKSKLGYFESSFFELGFHETLMYVSKSQLHDIIRHELAHYLLFIQLGSTIQPHGIEFRTFCLSLGWGQNVFAATCCLEKEESPVEASGILRKVQRLMALSQSANPNEAELAMMKAQELLLKHNMDSSYLKSLDEDQVLLKRIMQQKKEDGKMRAIARILETFFVSVVYRKAAGFVCLEILGDPVNVEIAEYVAGYLSCELDLLWKNAKTHSELKGLIAKNSFFHGIAKGYCTKIDALKRSYDQSTSHALMVIEKKLIHAKTLVYPKLSQSKSTRNHCPGSSALGEAAGKSLTINPALKPKTVLSLC
jgi:hypothetical protein